MPKAGIQAWRSTNWNAGAPAAGSKPAHSISVTPKVTSEMARVRLRTRPFFEPSRFGTNSSRTDPMMGSRMAIESRGNPFTSRYLQK